MTNEFEEYVREYSSELTRFCLSLCGNISDADDLFQETWYKAMKNYQQYDREKSFKSWLFSICANTFRDNRRLFRNSRRFIFGSEEEKTRFFNSIPDLKEADRDTFLTIHSVVNKLPKKQKVVLALYYFKDYSVKEISEILEIPEGTVKSRLNTAKKQIKRRLTNE